MNKNNIYKAAIVGCGRIASEFDDDPLMKKNYGIASHAGAYADNPNVELIAAADISDERLAKFGKRWGVQKLYKNYKEMLKNEKIDILSICTWNSTHLEILKEVAQNGVKAVFCEKPISNSLESADEMLKIARENNIVLLVNHRRRWDKLYQDISKYICEGNLGNIQQVSCYYNAGIANTGCHLLDALRMFFGEVKTVAAWNKDESNKNDPDMDGSIKFENDVTVSLQSLPVKNYIIFEIDIYGSEGRLRIKDNGFDVAYWKAIKSERYAGCNELVGYEAPVTIGAPAMFKNAIRNIVECLSQNALPACNGKDGLKALELICAFYVSAQKGGQLTAIPLQDRDLIIKSK